MRAHIVFCLFLTLFCLKNCSSTNNTNTLVQVHGYCLNHERSILLHLKNNLMFNTTNSKKLVHWNQTEEENCCQWLGVTCNKKGHVIALDLSQESISRKLNGSSPLFSLQHLQSLNLSHNNLSGSFPKSVFQMQTLKVLDVSDNQNLHGSIPNFPPHGSSFHILNLKNTNFSGKLPNSISNLKQLSIIDLSYCQFNGTLPSSISQLTQLVYLDLSSNNFTGPLPSFNMSKNLTYLALFHNQLSGGLPSGHFEGLRNLVSIDLGFNIFNGSFPSSLLKLPSLRELKLPFNQFTGPLAEFEDASSSALEMLDLGNNNLQGPLPMSIFNLRKLRVIQLSSNKFNGTMRLDAIRRLSNLTTLGLRHNNLSIDVELKDDGHDLSAPFPTITNLMLGSCKLKRIPSFLRNQSLLLYLDLSNNEIEGGIPNWVWHLEFLMHLNLSCNSLTSFEGSSWNLSSNLYVVDLHSNQLQGAIPFIPKDATYLDYSNNNLSSFTPLDIGNHLPFITIISLSNNSFHGQIHESFCNATSLRLLDLSSNKFAGKIPECFATLMSGILRVLSFGGNRLQGNIADTIPTSCSLRLLDLNDNLLGGNIPKSLSNCQELQVLNLGKNALTGRFPCFLSNISTLRIMDLQSNKLHGSVGCPNNSSGDSWEMLHIVDLASNNFSGAISGALLNSWKAMMHDDKVGPEFGHLFLDVVDNYNPTNFKDLLSYLNKDLVAKLSKLVVNVPRSILDQGSADSYWVNLARYDDTISIVNKGHQVKLVKIQRAFAYVDMSSNYLEGPIPNELMHFKALNALNLSHNALWGHIPSSVENLKNLESLDLSNNSLGGEIPLQLTSLSYLGYLNLSYNHLVGEIPMGTQIQTFDQDSFEGNGELCGPPLTKNCINEPTSETPHSHDTESSIDWNFLSAELGFVSGFGVFIFPLILWKRWRLWYSKNVDEMLYRIIPQLDFVYQHRGGKRFRTLRWMY